MAATILVTGATGFVGSALVPELLARGNRVRAALRSEDSGRPLPPGVESAVVGPLGPETAWDRALLGVDAVIHLAARVHMMHETAVDPLEEYRRVNVAATAALAKAAAKAGVKRLVFVSTVKVNGEESAAPYRETDEPRPGDPYGVSKREAEDRLREIAAQTGLEVVIVRPPLVYGPEVKANFLKLLSAVDRGLPLPLGAVKNARSLVFRGNLVDAVALCAVHHKAAGNTYLVSDGRDLSTPELIRGVGAGLGRPARLLPVPAALLRLAGAAAGKKAAVDRLLGSLVVDSGKIRRELGWKPPFTVEEGLRATGQWYRARRGAGNGGRS